MGSATELNVDGIFESNQFIESKELLRSSSKDKTFSRKELVSQLIRSAAALLEEGENYPISDEEIASLSWVLNVIEGLNPQITNTNPLPVVDKDGERMRAKIKRDDLAENIPPSSLMPSNYAKDQRSCDDDTSSSDDERPKERRKSGRNSEKRYRDFAKARHCSKKERKERSRSSDKQNKLKSEYHKRAHSSDQCRTSSKNRSRPSNESDSSGSSDKGKYVQCYHCNRWGHARSNCWRRLRACLYCGDLEHFIKDCPKRGSWRTLNKSSERLVKGFKRKIFQGATSSSNECFSWRSNRKQRRLQEHKVSLAPKPQRLELSRRRRKNRNENHTEGIVQPAVTSVQKESTCSDSEDDVMELAQAWLNGVKEDVYDCQEEDTGKTTKFEKAASETEPKFQTLHCHVTRLKDTVSQPVKIQPTLKLQANMNNIEHEALVDEDRSESPNRKGKSKQHWLKKKKLSWKLPLTQTKKFQYTKRPWSKNRKDTEVVSDSFPRIESPELLEMTVGEQNFGVRDILDSQTKIVESNESSEIESAEVLLETKSQPEKLNDPSEEDIYVKLAIDSVKEISLEINCNSQPETEDSEFISEEFPSSRKFESLLVSSGENTEGIGERFPNVASTPDFFPESEEPNSSIVGSTNENAADHVESVSNSVSLIEKFVEVASEENSKFPGFQEVNYDEETQNRLKGLRLVRQKLDSSGIWKKVENCQSILTSIRKRVMTLEDGISKEKSIVLDSSAVRIAIEMNSN